MQKLKHHAVYLPLLILIGAYGMMAILGLIGSEEFYDILSGLNLSESMTTLLVHGVFVLDGGVALLLIFGNKLKRPFPWKLMFIWAGAWPWVPRVLEFISGLEPEVPDALLLSAAAFAAYKLYKKKGVIFFKDTPTAAPMSTGMPM